MCLPWHSCHFIKLTGAMRSGKRQEADETELQMRWNGGRTAEDGGEDGGKDGGKGTGGGESGELAARGGYGGIGAEEKPRQRPDGRERVSEKKICTKEGAKKWSAPPHPRQLSHRFNATSNCKPHGPVLAGLECSSPQVGPTSKQAHDFARLSGHELHFWLRNT